MQGIQIQTQITCTSCGKSHLVGSAPNNQQLNAQTWQTIGVPLAEATGPNTLDHFVRLAFHSNLEKQCTNIDCASRRNEPKEVTHKQDHEITNRPKVLVVHLMRFRRNSGGKLEKVRIKVTVQEILDLSNFYDGNG